MKKTHIAIVAAVIIVAVIAIAVTLGVVLSKKDDDKSKASVKAHPENEAYRYGKAAVATDSAICSKVSRLFHQNSCCCIALQRTLFCSGAWDVWMRAYQGEGVSICLGAGL